MIQAIFLSYASQDADTARLICDALRAAGLEVWFDQSELRGGDAWDASIRKQIKECALFIPMISASTNARSEGYFRLEWKLAVDRSHLMADDQIFFLPVILDDTPEPTARVPDKFRERQWTRLKEASAVAAFAALVAKLLAGRGVSVINASNTAPVEGFGIVAPMRAVSVRPSIAVLPFTNMSASPDDEYFADGITEEIINALAQIEGLKVAARTSCFAFKGRNEDLRVVAEKLGVSSVLEGSVRKAGSKLRVTAQLINAIDGCHLWSERYDRELVDVFAMQDELASAIAAKLQVSMSGQLSGKPRPAIKNTEAYELLLKGRVLLNRRGRALLESRVCLERAVALEPDNAEALAQLANCYRLHSLYAIAPSNEMMPRARALAERALTLDPQSIEALTTLANIVGTFDWDPVASFALSDRVRARDPLNIRALCEPAYWLSLLDTDPAKMDRALADLGTARNLDPLNAWVAAMHAASLRFAGKFSDAIAAARHALELDSENFLAHWSVVITLAASARFDEATIAADAALRMSGRHPWILAELAGIHAARGDIEGAGAVYRELEARSDTEYIPWAEQAAAAAAAGNIEDARRLVQKAITARDVFVLYWKLSAWAPLRADPEGNKILRSTGL